jgi:hypothetical protein
MTVHSDSYRCRNHPDREGIGVCVRCRRVVCAECSTKIDRMNFCTGCLASITAATRRDGDKPARSGTAAGIAALIGGYAALAGLFMLLGLLLATLLRPGL